MALKPAGRGLLKLGVLRRFGAIVERGFVNWQIQQPGWVKGTHGRQFKGCGRHQGGSFNYSVLFNAVAREHPERRRPDACCRGGLAALLSHREQFLDILCKGICLSVVWHQTAVLDAIMKSTAS